MAGKDILCCILNHNDNAAAIRWCELLSPDFPTLILDSGSNPPCEHPSAVKLDNIYYSGLLNTAYQKAVEGGYKWVTVITSDVVISEKSAVKLRAAMKEVSAALNVGLYQPSTAWKGRSHLQSRCHFTGGMRKTNFQEGWFHMVRTDLLGKICPIDTSVNRLGWGPDLALSHFARLGRLLVIVDDRVRVVHPGGSGYNREEAERQMQSWFQTIPGYTSPRHFRPLRDKIKYAE